MERVIFSFFTFCLHMTCYWGLGSILYSLADKNREKPISEEKIIKRVLTNQMMILFMSFFAYPYIIFATENLSFIAYIIQFIIMFIVEDVGFYYTHRLFHTFYFYKYHKQHHEFYNPIGISALYCGILEFVITNLAPVGLSVIMVSKYIPMTLEVYSIWIVLGTLNTVYEHSSLAGDPIRRHYYHHQNSNKNYGVVGLMDYIHGTLEVSSRVRPLQ